MLSCLTPAHLVSSTSVASVFEDCPCGLFLLHTIPCASIAFRNLSRLGNTSLAIIHTVSFLMEHSLPLPRRLWASLNYFPESLIPCSPWTLIFAFLSTASMPFVWALPRCLANPSKTSCLEVALTVRGWVVR